MDVKLSEKFKKSGENYFKENQFELAIKDLNLSLEADPNDIRVLSMLADSYIAQEQYDKAIDYFNRALAIDPVNTEILIKFSGLRLSGPNYLEFLEAAHKHHKPKKYIEIGVCKGASFKLATKDTRSIGIDPEPQLEFIGNLPRLHTIIRDTSDNYFKSGRFDKDFDGTSFDMAFLDGMHLFEYALRDFINLEKKSNSNSVIYIHDLFPMNAETATRERKSDFWSGDVWKLVLCLTKYRPDLELKVLPCPPTGLGIVKKLDSKSTILKDDYKHILNEFINMPFDTLKEKKDEKLKLVSVEEVDAIIA